MAELLQQSGDVPMSYNNAEVNRVASELQALTMDPDEVVVRLEVA